MKLLTFFLLIFVMILSSCDKNSQVIDDAPYTAEELAAVNAMRERMLDSVRSKGIALETFRPNLDTAAIVSLLRRDGTVDRVFSWDAFGASLQDLQQRQVSLGQLPRGSEVPEALHKALLGAKTKAEADSIAAIIRKDYPEAIFILK